MVRDINPILSLLDNYEPCLTIEISKMSPWMLTVFVLLLEVILQVSLTIFIKHHVLF